jgi:hypothetical protein
MSPSCPHEQVVVAGVATSHKKKLSVSKGILGGMLFGPLGAVAGGAVLGKHSSKHKTQFVCVKCGKTLDKKPRNARVIV